MGLFLDGREDGFALQHRPRQRQQQRAEVRRIGDAVGIVHHALGANILAHQRHDLATIGVFGRIRVDVDADARVFV